MPLALVAAATMTLANLLALRQDGLRRVLAYSSLAHAGYLAAALCAWIPSGGPPATLFAYLAAYLFMNTGAFLFVRLSGVERLAGLRGFARRAPLPAAAFAVLLSALAGIPPTTGFLVKLYVLLDLFAGGHAALAACLALNSLIGLGYYLNMVRLMYLDPPEEGTAAVPPAPDGEATLVLAACAAVSALLGLAPSLRQWLSAVLR